MTGPEVAEAHAEGYRLGVLREHDAHERDMGRVRDDLLALVPADRQEGLSTAPLAVVLSVAFDHVACLQWLLAEARHERDSAIRMDDVRKSFYDLAIKERDLAWVQVERLTGERDEARAALSSRDTTTPPKPADLVREFHAAFGCMMNVPDSRQAREDRNVLHREEHRELVEALEGDEPLTAVAKELADVTFVCYGTALALGIDLDRAVALVHESNMSKLGADGRPVLREDGKVLKGPGYREPDMSGALLPAAAPVGQDTQEPGSHADGKFWFTSAEVAYDNFITTLPQEDQDLSVWYEATCEAADCGWITDGTESVVRDAAYEHVAEKHVGPEHPFAGGGS